MWFFVSCDKNDEDVIPNHQEEVILDNQENKKPLTDLLIELQETSVFAHRVNTKNELETLFQYYKGVELDVFFDDKTSRFSVKHDVDAVADLTLQEYFEIGNANEDLLYWIDFKNLQDVSVNLVNDRMIELDNIYNIKQRFFFESWDVQKISYLSDYGYYTSFWTPTLASSDGDTTKVISTIKNAIANYNFDFISCEVTMYELFNNNFPEIKHNYWTVYGSDEEQIIREYKNSDKTAVILVDDRELY